MWMWEHPGKGAAARRALLFLLILYGGGFLLLRLTENLPAAPEILREPVRQNLQSFFLPCYLIENLAARLTVTNQR